MKQRRFMPFLAGFITGALFLFVIFNARYNNSEAEETRETISEQTASPEKKNYSENYQFVEVRGKKGNATLHTGMSKDSVQSLLGKPDQVDLTTLGKTHHETWGYKVRNKYIPDLEIEFRNGKLDGVRQR